MQQYLDVISCISDYESETATVATIEGSKLSSRARRFKGETARVG